MIKSLITLHRPIWSGLMLLAAAFMLLLAIGACKSNTGPTTDRPLDAPTNPSAYSKDDSTVVLFWTASRSRDLSVFDKYRVTAFDALDTVVAMGLTSSGADTSMTVTGLSGGQTYTFTIVATVVAGASGYTESAPASIEWAPASRFIRDTVGLLHLYAAIAFPDSCGLIVFDSTIGGPRRASLVPPVRDSLALDFVVNSEGSPMYIRSADYWNAGWRESRFSTVVDVAASLDHPRLAPPDAVTYTESSLQISNSVISGSRIAYFRTADGNYGRVLVERDPSTGTLIWGPIAARYLTLQISYQSTPDIPYSERARLEGVKR